MVLSMTVAEALSVAQERLRRAGVESAEVEAGALVEALLGVTRADLFLNRTRRLSDAEAKQLEAWLLRREACEPLQHIVGVAHFYGLTLQVTPDTLIPRPETEGLVELGLRALKHLPQPKVLDIGTGSGAIALALKAECPAAEVWATDLSAAALEVATRNAKQLKLEISCVRSDLLSAPEIRGFSQRADLLISNLPYLPQADAAWLSPEVQREPPEALFSGVDGLAHASKLMVQAGLLLKPGAVCLLELDPRNVARAQAESSLWSSATVHTDLTGRARFLQLTR